MERVRNAWGFGAIARCAGRRQDIRAYGRLKCKPSAMSFLKQSKEMDKRGWEMMGYNVTNSRSLRNHSPGSGTKIIHTTLKISNSQRERRCADGGVRGSRNLQHVDILAAAESIYRDWNNDDVPYPDESKSGRYVRPELTAMQSRHQLLWQGSHGRRYYQMVAINSTHFIRTGQKVPRVMGIPLHPFHTGRPLRINTSKRRSST